MSEGHSPPPKKCEYNGNSNISNTLIFNVLIDIGCYNTIFEV